MLSDNAEKPGTVKLTLARPTAHIDNKPLSVSQSAQQQHNEKDRRSFNRDRMTIKQEKQPRKSDAVFNCCTVKSSVGLISLLATSEESSVATVTQMIPDRTSRLNCSRYSKSANMRLA